jgi:hypothetical protein
MAGRKKAPQSNGTTAAPAVETAGGVAGAPEPPVVPAPPDPFVQNLPEAVKDLTYLQLISLTTAALRTPYKFLKGATNPDKMDDPSFRCKVVFKKIRFQELRQVMAALLPDEDLTKIVGNMRVQRYLFTTKINRLSPKIFQEIEGLPDSELETAVVRLINKLMPLGQKDTAELSAWGEEEWRAKRRSHREHVFEVIQHIEDAIRDRITLGERDPRIVCTKDLPLRFFKVNTDDLGWRMAPPRNLVCIYYEDVPTDCILRQLDPERLPSLSKTVTRPMVILGISRGYIHGTATDDLARNAQKALEAQELMVQPYYSLPEIWYYNYTGWGVHAQRRLDGLKELTDTEEGSARYEAHKKLMKKVLTPIWQPEIQPAVPTLEGYANRVLYFIDLVSNLQRYIRQPPLNLSLGDLLTARRMFVTEEDERLPEGKIQAAISYTSKWYSNYKRDELAEALWDVARTTLEALSHLEAETREHMMELYQNKFYLKDDDQ